MTLSAATQQAIQDMNFDPDLEALLCRFISERESEHLVCLWDFALQADKTALGLSAKDALKVMQPISEGLLFSDVDTGVMLLHRSRVGSCCSRATEASRLKGTRSSCVLAAKP